MHYHHRPLPNRMSLNPPVNKFFFLVPAINSYASIVWQVGMKTGRLADKQTTNKIVIQCVFLLSVLHDFELKRGKRRIDENKTTDVYACILN